MDFDVQMLFSFFSSGMLLRDFQTPVAGGLPAAIYDMGKSLLGNDSVPFLNPFLR